MARRIFTIKVFIVFGYSLLLEPVPSIAAQIMAEQSAPKQLPEWFLFLLIFMMFVPELALKFSPFFREWLKRGIEDADGKLDKSDIRDMMAFYTSLWSIRVFLIFSWAFVFYGIDIPYHFFVTPLLGGFGLAALPVVKSLVNRFHGPIRS